MAANDISLGFPDSQNVTVFMDGKHVATMTNAPGYEDGIPMELFSMMRAAPDLLAALKHLLGIVESLASEATGPQLRNSYMSMGDQARAAINKAEGRAEG
jgi:hypothetical protein